MLKSPRYVVVYLPIPATTFRGGHHSHIIMQVRFGQVKRKLGISTEGTSPASRTTTPKKAAGPKTPSKATKVPKTPAGRVGSKGKGAKKTKGENDNDEQDNNAERDTTAKKEEEAQDTDVGVLPEYEAMAGLPDPF